MTSPQYKDKELQIIRALMELLSSGKNISDIKTSDIADAAGIGKGTLYNYFATKEDIIAKTIIYSIETGLDNIFAQMDAAPDFQRKCYCIMHSIHDIISNESSDFHLMLFNFCGKQMKQLLGSDLSFIQKSLDTMFDKTMLLAKLGAEEKLFPLPEDSEYAYSAFSAALMSFIHARSRILEQQEVKKLNRAMDNAYRLLIKALN